MKSKRKYFPQINIIKAIASFSVTAVHFRNRVEKTIPEAIINNKIKLFFSSNYAFFIFAVPLFLIATGFLSTHKKNNIKNIINTIKIYGLYLFIAFTSFAVMILTNTREFNGWRDMISRALSFNLISGWYIELFIGLALIIPFLNIIVHNISKKQFQSFIIILLAIVAVPAFVNKNPDFSNIYLPNYWQSIYPIVYYFIGAYIRLYYKDIKISNRILIIIYFSSVFFITQLLYRYADPYTWAAEGYYASIINILLASSFFLLIFKNIHKSNSFFNFISKYTLSTYIMAYPVDKIIYPFFTKLFQPIKNLLIFSPLIVAFTFSISLISGVVLYKIFNYLWIHFIQKNITGMSTL